ncbi:hypothetical protein [Geothrix sp. 21YS21S-4]|uniref:hypothetical protein n=1 Tax=Geothrix sp. 21YS21S-4 TaxID=3068889 RepID=UPI0027B92849|nr:hypothetical protein [Geothrix sp. 21YS21S-4]
MKRMLFPLLAVPLVVQATPPVPQPDPFAAVRFLEGTWRGEGEGRPGPSLGASTFRFELGGQALILRSYADSAASRHEDLMATFVEGGVLKAFYLDSEGHVIRYRVTAAADGAVFESEAGPGPRFRLTYRRTAKDRLGLTFEMAAPDAPSAYKPYLQATLRRGE